MSEQSSFGRKISDKTYAVYEIAERVDQVASQVIPVLQQAAEGNRAAIKTSQEKLEVLQKELKSLQVVIDSMKDRQSEFEAATGHLTEAGKDTEALLEESAAVATLAQGDYIYHSYNAATVRHDIENVDLDIWQEQMEMTSQARFDEFWLRMERAKAGRYHRSLRIDETDNA